MSTIGLIESSNEGAAPATRFNVQGKQYNFFSKYYMTIYFCVRVLEIRTIYSWCATWFVAGGFVLLYGE